MPCREAGQQNELLSGKRKGARVAHTPSSSLKVVKKMEESVRGFLLCVEMRMRSDQRHESRKKGHEE
jgi:hypothetical protein